MSVKTVFEKHPHWQDLLITVEKITAAGFTAYLAGGCVRDAILGRDAHDFDVATSATPDEVHKLFPHAVDVGRQFGVMIVPFDGFQIEVATFRRDGDYKDGRHPETISYSDAQGDAERRDFTVNALFYDLKQDRVLDHVGGLADIERRVLRAVGDPEARFSEDKLRMLRAMRFSAQLGFAIDPPTFAAIHKQAAEIKVVSKERVTEEFKKLSVARDISRGLEQMRESGLWTEIWKTHSESSTLAEDRKWWPIFVRSQSLLRGSGGLAGFVASQLICESLRAGLTTHCQVDWARLPFVLSRATKQDIEFLLRGFFIFQQGQNESLLLLNEEGGPLLSELGFVFTELGFLPPHAVSAWIEKFLAIADGEGRLPEPFLSGADLKALGVPASRQMGDLLKQSYMAQITGQLKTKKQAQDWVLERLGS